MAGMVNNQRGFIRLARGTGGLEPHQYTADHFIYTANIGNLAAGANATANFNIQGDSSFEWVMSTVYGNLHSASEPISDASLIPVTIQITDGGSGRQLFYAPVPISSIAGSGKQPFILPETRIFAELSTVQVAASNFDASDQYDNIYLNFIGRKVFDLGPLPMNHPWYNDPRNWTA